MPKLPQYTIVDGLRIPPVAIDDMVRAATQFKPDKEDVVVATYLKCGTTWTTQIVSMILRKGVPHSSTLEYFSTTPYVEVTDIAQLDKLPRPRCIKTHMPFNKLNWSEDTKYIWTTRHPADCCVSLYHHTKLFPCYCYIDGNFDDYFELFLKGEVDYNDFFDHLLSWYEQRHRPNLLCMTYEEMKRDLRSAVLKIARHIGEEHYQELIANDEELLKKVLYYCSFEYMKNHVNDFFREGFVDPPAEICQTDRVLKKNFQLVSSAKKCGHKSVGEFIRKGVVGDGKITFSEEQKEKLRARIKEKTGHTDVMKLWEDYDF